MRADAYDSGWGSTVMLSLMSSAYLWLVFSMLGCNLLFITDLAHSEVLGSSVVLYRWFTKIQGEGGANGKLGLVVRACSPLREEWEGSHALVR